VNSDEESEPENSERVMYKFVETEEIPDSIPNNTNLLYKVKKSEFLEELSKEEIGYV
jgi:hypothetical protein